MSYEPTQEECGRVVERNVNLCVTGVVEKLFEHEPELREDCENLWLHICPECGESVPQDAVYDGTDAAGDPAYQCTHCESYIDLDACDTEPQEVYEWWAVSDWFADRLAEHDEVLHRDLYGLTVWGRCATGQAILLDCVTVAITRALHESIGQGDSDHG
jgi:hypothetical protein